MPVQDHYAALGLPRDASAEDIKKAFRRLTLELHPDRWPDDPEATDRFQAVANAYAVLGDAAKRGHYDQQLERSLVGYDIATGEVPDIGRLVDSLVGDLFGTRRTHRREGTDLRYTLTVDLEEAALGCEKRIEFEARGACGSCDGTGTRPGGAPARVCDHCRGKGEVKSGGILSQRSPCGRCQGLGLIQEDPCKDCRGRGHRRQQRAFVVRIPSGTEGGSERVLRGEGEPGRYGGRPGDLRVTVAVREHPWLRREGLDLHCDAPVPVSTVSLGGTVEVPTLSGRAAVKVPRDVRAGAVLRLRGQGIVGADGTRGHLFVTLCMEAPVVASTAARDAVEALASMTQHEPPVFPRSDSLRDYLSRARSSDGEGDSG